MAGHVSEGGAGELWVEEEVEEAEAAAFAFPPPPQYSTASNSKLLPITGYWP